MKIAIASGKGGTGKSTISTNLAYLLSKKYNNVAILDCDVEEPNCHIFLKPELTLSQNISIPTPLIDKDKCIACGKCVEVCQFNSLALIKKNILVFNDLCHGCGSCKINCPTEAISEAGRIVGIIEKGKTNNFNFIHGKSRIGEAMSPPLIKAVKEYANTQNYDIEILDCPPGTSCPVITAVESVDFVVLVTEPTPFGFNDLKLAVGVMQKLNKPFGIVINRSTENDYIIEDWAKENNIRILTKIPDCFEAAKTYSKGELIVKELPELEEHFEPLMNLVKEGIND